MTEQTPTDRIGRDDGTGYGPIVRVPDEQVDAMRSIVDANRRAIGLPPQEPTVVSRPGGGDRDTGKDTDQ